MGRIVKLAAPHGEYDVENGKLVWKQKARGVTLFILEGYCQQTLANYNRLVGMLRTEFPEHATDDRVVCGHVTRSDTYDGFTLVSLCLNDYDRTKLSAEWFVGDVDFNY